MIDRAETLRKLALNTARLTGIAPLLRPWTAGVGVILMLHRVTAAPGKPLAINDHLSISPAFLDVLIADMKRSGYVFIGLDEAIDRLKRGGRGPRFATVTADDAYRDNLLEALPILEKHDTPVTIYVAPGLIDGTVDLWWDLLEDVVTARERIEMKTPQGPLDLECSTRAGKREASARLHDFFTREVAEEHQSEAVRALADSAGLDFTAPRRETLMNWDEIRGMARHPLVTIGAHTVHHYNLRRLSEEAALREIVDAGRALALHLGETPRHMAYPYGYESAVGPREVALACGAGYESAVTTRHGVLRAEHADHLHALPRLSVNGRYQRLAHMRTMLTGVTTPLANGGKLLVTV
ncbi:polysaccharide deacetylase [Mesorhizobium sp. L-8-10]|uniref:polysaccharide deacetylase family protein n=1 Tax=Mesorhizobium sp. L-8-10 TaxID=2744523 RepID=UPI0019280B5A|nr:polysaccharide deacetylase family protein [Mesorhizobium sp. L-8-10]BCH33674.1 polysaccharide deacetylase [Mesorhizobium sp. L-8-10]